MTKLLPTGSCGIHSIHEVFQTEEDKTDQDVEKLLKALYQIFPGTPARHADYTDVTGSQQLITAWIKDEKVATRAIDVWKNIQLCNFYQILAKDKEPSSKSCI